MTAYGIAHLHSGSPHPDVLEYIRRIQETLDPFEGRFLVHGGRLDVLEGSWPGDLVLIAFPDAATAHAWYRSPAYQRILPLRTEHFGGDVAIVEGVGPDYDPAAKADALAEALDV
ncbi:DUF1330 domain-containing protein [Streptomyces sp. 549]|uniref:DUF1330 domain-containing protein n=1 Tax=Streptomyces sp. 549 TaxID=3049076 RepID=UPI0024C32DF7|nr:DUF1330 domain-containing protein [Streptomyces sp. 549]MDK1472666.1 DUF1330 domain-containing protein [Streptomyces sp. 549]